MKKFLFGLLCMSFTAHSLAAESGAVGDPCNDGAGTLAIQENLVDTAIIRHGSCSVDTGAYPYTDDNNTLAYNLFFIAEPNTSYTYKLQSIGNRQGVFEYDTIINPDNYTTEQKITPTNVIRQGATSGLSTDTFTTSANAKMVMLGLANTAGPTPTGVQLYPTNRPIGTLYCDLTRPAPVQNLCPNLYNMQTMQIQDITLSQLPNVRPTPSGSLGTSVVIPIRENTTYTVAIIDNTSIGYTYLFRVATTSSTNLPTQAIAYKANQTYEPITINSGSGAKYMYVQMQTPEINDAIQNLMVIEGDTVPTTHCLPFSSIKIATTKYNEDAFADLITTLNSAITKVTNIVDTTVAQANSIGTLATTKQDRPADGDCPAGRKCLLVTGTDGKPHWYLIQE